MQVFMSQTKMIATDMDDYLIQSGTYWHLLQTSLINCGTTEFSHKPWLVLMSLFQQGISNSRVNITMIMNDSLGKDVEKSGHSPFK